MTMNEIIKRLCGLYDVQQGELAEAIGVSPQTMSGFIRGHTEMRMSNVVKAFAYFGIRPTEDFHEAVIESLDGDTDLLTNLTS